MSTNRKPSRGFVWILVLFASTPIAGRQPRVTPADEVGAIQAARQVELVEIELLLADPAAEGHRDALRRLIHIASTYPELPTAVRDLLILSTGLPDHQNASLAERALHAFDHPVDDTVEQVLTEGTVDDAVLRRHAQANALERIQLALAGQGPDPGPEARRAAARDLVHLAGSVRRAGPAEEVRWLLETLRRDPDPIVAALAERAIAAKATAAGDGP